MNVKFVVKTVGTIVTGVCTLAGYGLLVSAPIVTFGKRASNERDAASPGYLDAVNAILDSDIWSSDKQELISELKRDGNAEFYKTVISVVKNTDMWASDRVEVIHSLCED